MNNSKAVQLTKDFKPNYICIDKPEIKLASQDKYSDIERIAQKIIKNLSANLFGGYSWGKRTYRGYL
jgi:hypothetical protein